MKVESAQAKDYDEMVNIWEASVRATHLFLKEEDILYFKPLIRNQYLKAVTLYCVRNEKGFIEGFIGISEDKIEMLFINPAVQGKGIGKLLTQFAINNLGVSKVDVNEQNHQAVGFYQHLGFKVINRSALDSLGKPYPILSMALT
ncbi:GNAT family N-acetyltransferase [Adhaeribacter rhizoryzae]|uniref:GNAT family N-acetyltransferase n=1 Tax=Adhaeribacter rhizoryzae TaxID=2607907 RepID=A0A5M6DBG6_9BACT|nr:GNAT family N-acetyltransferase [Adhaeribacter rhizoryzae]